MNMAEEIKRKTAEIDAIIESFMPEEEDYQATVIDAMKYSIASGGKRIRPLLMSETYKMFGGEGEGVEYFMAAIEMIHTYSLVHDDLPCMDDDEYRRGRKTTHTVYGENMAVLAGDALLNYAAETALGALDSDIDPARIGKAMRVLFNKSGINGMIGGQTADVEAENKEPSEVTEDLIEYIHVNKTAALIEASMMIGGILAGADTIQVNTLERIARNVGIAFQIQDDILDVTGDFKELGKPIGSDERNHKVTYVSLHGLEQSKADVEALSKEATILLHTLEAENPFLEQLLLGMIDRKK
ncbi:MAG: polyprenyl synthetase family protein [Lachnospiraceae bacterium]|nr:polyprenyl synthetase family protein [Lachnospiraceae bacterium]